MITDDVSCHTSKRIVCRHGMTCELVMETVRTETGYVTKVSQAICQECMREMAVEALAYALSTASPIAR